MPSYHDLKVGETLRLAGQGEVQVTLLAKSGRRARLAIEADAGVEIRPDPVAAGSTGRGGADDAGGEDQAESSSDPRRYSGRVANDGRRTRLNAGDYWVLAVQAAVQGKKS